MIVTLSPMRMDQTLTAARSGSVLVLNGTPVDLAGYDMAAAPNPWIVGEPFEAAGVWHVTLILPHGSEAPEGARFPAPLTLAADGPVDLPPYEAAPVADPESDPESDPAGAGGGAGDGGEAPAG